MRIAVNNLIASTGAIHMLKGTNNSVSYRANGRLGFAIISILLFYIEAT